jgi:glycosyltransferase involved in cell wall biosynthesis
LEAELRMRITQHGLDSKIHLLGEIANPHPWYKRAAAFVLSSDWEGYPNVLLEALAHGLPVVATDCEFGPAQILGEGRFGRLVTSEAMQELADAMKELCNNLISHEAWDASLYSAPIIANQYLLFLDEMVQ